MNSAYTPAKPLNARSQRKRDQGLDSIDIMVFLIPCLRFLQVKIIGILNGADILLLAVFLLLAVRGKIRIESSVGKRFVFLCSLWLLSQCVTDIVRHTAFADYMRGWSNIGLTLVDFAVLYTLLYHRPRRLLLYGWGLAVGSLLTFLLNPDEYMVDAPWKFGIALPLSLAVILIVSRKNCSLRLSAILTGSVGMTNIAMGARGTGGMCLGVSLYILVNRYFARKSAGSSRMKAKSVVIVVASLGLGAAGILGMYQFAARTGILGEDAREKYEKQSGGQYGLLLGGRVEALGSLPAIYDSPILGHGSWARDPGYLLAERQALALMGYIDPSEIIDNEFEEGLIPAHSYLLGAWVNAGILGALFWGWVWVVTARTLARVYPANFELLPIAAFVGFGLLWDILFSPYGAEMRIISPFYVVMMMTCLGMAPNKAVQAPRSVARSLAIAGPAPKL